MSRSSRATPERSTIHDVARIAGVSTATVSRALSGAKPVSAEVASRVRDAVREVGYRPNPAAQVLLRGRSHTIGVVAPDLANPYFAEILKGVAAEASEGGWHTLVAGTDEDPEQEYRAAMELARWVDGLLLCAPRMSTTLLKEVAAATPSLVLVNRLVQHPSVAAVVVDYYRGVRRLCEHLESLGHRRLVYLAGPPHAWSERQRQRGLRAAEARGQTVVRVPCGSGIPDGYAAVEEALRHRPTAVVGFNDNVALGALSRLRELGVDVPGEVSIAGIDDVPMSALTDPGLTTVAVPKVELGRLAWQRFETDPAAAATRVPVELVVRGSTGPAPRRRRTSPVAKR